MENNNGAATTAEAKQEVSKAIQKAMPSKPGTMAGLKQTSIAARIEMMRPQIAQAIPKHLTADRLIQMAATLIARNPKIAECSERSLMGAVLQASILGFEPVEALGLCYLVPYGGEVQFQLGYRGWMSLARKSGELKMMYAEVVREGDEFEFEFGLEPKITHKPKSDSDRKLTHVYAVAHYKDGGYNFVVLSKSQVEKLRLRSPMQKADASGAWKTDYDAMAKAKAIKQLAKYLPTSIEFQNAALADEAIISDKAFTNDRSGGLKVEEFDYSVELKDVPAADVQNDDEHENE